MTSFSDAQTAASSGAPEPASPPQNGRQAEQTSTFVHNFSPDFDAARIETGFYYVNDCPERFLPKMVAGVGGTLEQRIQCLVQWRSALLNGQMPPETAWPPPSAAMPARKALESLEILKFCQNNPEVVDDLLEDVLDSLEAADASFLDRLRTLLEQLLVLEERRHALKTPEQQHGNSGKFPVPGQRPSPISEQRLRELTDRAHKRVSRAFAARKADRTLLRKWQARVRIWSDLEEVFGELEGRLTGLGLDLTHGVLHHAGWKNMLRLHELIQMLPQVKEIIRTLGRMQENAQQECGAATVVEPLRRLEEYREEAWHKDLPGEMRGVEHSGDIGRMLPSEASLLGHPRLKYLWHAKRAEQALLCYHVEGILTERRWREAEHLRTIDLKKKTDERGPIVLVLDTSGSMAGLPETVAKALTLEALRIARAEKRRCYLFAFAGPGDVCEKELDLSPQGVGSLLDFLSMSFGSGTDIGVLRRVVTKLSREDWKKADVLLVSDGVWHVKEDLVRQVSQAKQNNGVRFHGVQIGNSRFSPMGRICDPLHRFDRWLALTGGLESA